jgi:hypothetical protein
MIQLLIVNLGVRFDQSKTHKSTALMAARGDTNIPNEFRTVMKVPGELTKRHGLITYPTTHMIKLPLLTSIHLGAIDARSMPAATEFWTRFTYP